MPTRVCRGAWVFRATYSSHQLQPRAHGTFCVVLVGLGVAEVDQNTIAHVLRDEPTEALHGLGDALLVGRNDLAEIFRVHARRERRRADQVGEHHRHLTALGAVFGRCAWSTGRGRYVNGGRFTARIRCAEPRWHRVGYGDARVR